MPANSNNDPTGTEHTAFMKLPAAQATKIMHDRKRKVKVAAKGRAIKGGKK
jgi:hypothetical protein